MIGYWAIPTAPPWYAARHGLMEDGRTPELRRMMVEYGEQFWKSGLGAFVRCPGRQPPGRHAFAAFRHLRDGRARARGHGPVAGALGWTYAATLGLALVYLGEHYVVDLAAGLALAESIRAATPIATPFATQRSPGRCRRSRHKALA